MIVVTASPTHEDEATYNVIDNIQLFLVLFLTVTVATVDLRHR